jgi:hypothetical protein
MDVVPAEREKWLHEPFAAVQARTSAPILWKFDKLPPWWIIC